MEDGERCWRIIDGKNIYGPIPWLEVRELVENGELTRWAYVKKETWPNWVPISYYVPDSYLLKDANIFDIVHIAKPLIVFCILTFLLFAPMWYAYFLSLEERTLGPIEPPIVNYIVLIMFFICLSSMMKRTSMLPKLRRISPLLAIVQILMIFMVVILTIIGIIFSLMGELIAMGLPVYVPGIKVGYVLFIGGLFFALSLSMIFIKGITVFRIMGEKWLKKIYQ